MATFYYVGEDIALPEHYKTTFTAEQLKSPDVLGFDPAAIKTTDTVRLYRKLDDAQRVAKASANPDEDHQFMVFEVTTDKDFNDKALPEVTLQVEELVKVKEGKIETAKKVTNDITALVAPLSALTVVNANFGHLDYGTQYYYNDRPVALNLKLAVKPEQAPAPVEDAKKEAAPAPVADAKKEAAPVAEAKKDAAPVEEAKKDAAPAPVADAKKDAAPAPDAKKEEAPTSETGKEAPKAPAPKKEEQAKKANILSSLFATARNFVTNNSAGLLFGTATAALLHLSGLSTVGAGLVAAKATALPLVMVGVLANPLTISFLAGAAVLGLASVAARLTTPAAPQAPKPAEAPKLTDADRYESAYSELKGNTKELRRELGYVRRAEVKTSFKDRLIDIKELMEAKPLFKDDGALVAPEAQPSNDKLRELTAYKRHLDTVKALKSDEKSNADKIHREERKMVRGERVREKVSVKI